MSRGLIIVGSDEAIWATPNPAKKSFSFCPLSVVLYESLNSVRTYVRFVCEWDHRPLCRVRETPVGRLLPG